MPSEPNTTESMGDETHIRNILQALAAAWNAHDSEAFALLFAEDADFTNVRGATAHGRSGVEKFHAPIFATIFKDSSLKIDKVKVRFIKTDVAAVDEWWELTGARSSDGDEIPLRKGLLSLLMTKQDADWVIAVMHNSDLPIAS